MLYMPAVAAFFKYKIVYSVIVLVCGNKFEQIQVLRQLSRHGLRATATCYPTVLDQMQTRLQGVLYVAQHNDTILDQVKQDHFAIWNKWLVVSEEIPGKLKSMRYDADVVLLNRLQTDAGYLTGITANTTSLASSAVSFEDVYAHPGGGSSRHAWAAWAPAGGLQLRHERDRLLRRLDLKRYPMRIATPIGHYDEAEYGGSFAQYVLDNSMPERDSAIRCGYGASALILEALNAEEMIVQVQLWSTVVGNSTSMMTKLADGTSELSGSTLRMRTDRIERLDYVMPIWPFIVGFTYLSERESSSNMFVMPFSGAVWGACAALVLLLALAQRATAKAPVERDGAFVAVVATWLQQDASAVPDGASGRMTFMMLSMFSMLVYAYYSSAIVSALMAAGGGGPTSLRDLADSRYALASEDYDWIRYLMFDVKTNWEDLEYLKRKKMTSNFYQSTERGMQLVLEGNTAFHAEYNHVYPLMNIFSDEQICKVQYVHTVPEIMSWVTTTKRGQWLDVFRTAGGWVHETGLAKRLLSRWQVKPPPCRAALLAERVKYGDVAPLIVLTTVGFIASVVLLFVERAVARWKGFTNVKSIHNDSGITDDDDID
ncbi:ionotropic receptor 75a-like isoform X2 [Choristoneura fumiferana]|uniref:ionotropic receptor 75a-like isoform X2 n=1 Tax=Choristoneura fumiferana TaxID=7141 RepID=UPI003D15D789